MTSVILKRNIKKSIASPSSLDKFGVYGGSKVRFPQSLSASWWRKKRLRTANAHDVTVFPRGFCPPSPIASLRSDALGDDSDLETQGSPSLSYLTLPIIEELHFLVAWLDLKAR